MKSTHVKKTKPLRVNPLLTARGWVRSPGLAGLCPYPPPDGTRAVQIISLGSPSTHWTTKSTSKKRLEGMLVQLAFHSPLGILPPTLVPCVLHPSGQTGSQVTPPPFFRCDGILLSSKVTLLAVSTASCKSHHLLDTHLTPTMTVAMVSMKRARPSQAWMCSALYKCQGPRLNLGADSPLELHFYTKILKYICRCLWFF